jgi:formiminoglutamase
VVDAFIDFDPSTEDFSDNSFLNMLIADFGTENIEDLNLLGCQTYYCSGKQEDFLSENYFRIDRLKDLRGGKIGNVDVLLRQMEVLSFDFSAIKGQAVLPHGHRMPNGFSEEEVCRIFWYAGASDVLKVAGIFNMPESKTGEDSSAPLAAQICWHFLEGRGARSGDYPLRPVEDYELKVVYLDEYDETLKFYFNPENGRWWVLVPAEQNERLVPCRGEDYQAATEQELPAVWWHYFIKNKED